MNSPAKTTTTGFLVHRGGRVEGPFELCFIEAMVLAGVYSADVAIREEGKKGVVALGKHPATQSKFAASYGGDLAMGQSRPKKRLRTEDKVYWGLAIAACLAGVMAVLWIIQERSRASKFKPQPTATSTSHSTPDSTAPTLSPSELFDQILSRHPTPPATKTPVFKPAPITSRAFKVPPPLSLDASTRSSPAEQKTVSNPAVDDSKVYRNATGQTYRVSNSDYFRLGVMESALTAKQSILDAEETKVESMANEVDRERPYLDRTSQTAVDLFNGKVDRLNAANHRLKLWVTDYNRDVDAFNAELHRVGTLIR